MTRYTLLYRMAAASLVVAALVGCAGRRMTPSLTVIAVPVGAPGTQASWQAGTGLVDLNPGPVVQFETSCARCHGPQGSLFGEGLASMDLHEMQREVVEMMVGPGELRPTRGQVEAMAAYHLAIREGSPFVVVDNAAAFTNRQDQTLRGEVTAGASVEIRKNGQVIPATVQDSTWILRDPPALPFAVVASQGPRQAGFGFPLQQWSATSQPAAPAPEEQAIMPVPSPD